MLPDTVPKTPNGLLVVDPTSKRARLETEALLPKMDATWDKPAPEPSIDRIPYCACVSLSGVMLIYMPLVAALNVAGSVPVMFRKFEVALDPLIVS